MALNVRFQYPTGSKLGLSVERLSDGLFLDFVDNTFRATPATLIYGLLEDSGSFLGRYKATLPTPAAQFTDGHYAVTIHDTANSVTNLVVAELATSIVGGNDAPAATVILANLASAQEAIIAEVQKPRPLLVGSGLAS